MHILRIDFKSIEKLTKIKKNLLTIKNKHKFKRVKINGPFNIKNKHKIYTVLKSPHVNKKSREHFIYKNYTQKIDLKFENCIQLFNFLILIRKRISSNILINIKIIRKNITTCL